MHIFHKNDWQESSTTAKNEPVFVFLNFFTGRFLWFGHAQSACFCLRTCKHQSSELSIHTQLRCLWAGSDSCHRPYIIKSVRPPTRVKGRPGNMHSFSFVLKLKEEQLPCTRMHPLALCLTLHVWRRHILRAALGKLLQDQRWFSTSWKSSISYLILRRWTVLRCSVVEMLSQGRLCSTSRRRVKSSRWSCMQKVSLKFTGPSLAALGPAQRTRRTTAMKWSTWTAEKCSCRQVSHSQPEII